MEGINEIKEAAGSSFPWYIVEIELKPGPYI
jgi:hypothetical protein